MNTLTFDIETTGLSLKNDRILCVAIKVNNSETTVYNDIGSFSDDWKEELESKDYLKIGHNLPFDIKFLRKQWGINVCGPYFDTKIASFYNNPHRIHKLKTIAKNVLNIDATERKDLIGKGQKKLTMEQIPTEELHKYNKSDVDLTYKLYQLWK